MSMSTIQGLKICSVVACLIGLSACSENDAANVSFKDVDRTNLPTEIIPNHDLGDDNVWTGWDASLVDANGSQASFSMVSSAISQGGNTLRAKISNVETGSVPEDIQVGPKEVAVTQGQAYGVGAFVQGPRCGLAKFVVSAADDPDNILAEEELFFTGAPQAFNYYFQVPADGPSAVNLPIQLSFVDNIGSDIFVDKVTAIPTVLPPQGEEGNVANNSSFEDSDADINVPFGDDKRDSWGQFGNATFTLDTTEAQEGNNSVKIEFEEAGAGYAWDIEAGLINVDVVEGWTYTLSAWVKGDDGAQVNFLVQNPGGTYNVFGQSDPFTVTSEWQEIRFDAMVSETEQGHVRLYSQFNFAENANKTIYIDNIKLIPPDTCPYNTAVPHMVSENEGLFEYDYVVNGSLEASDTEHTGWNTYVVDASDTSAAQATFEVNKALANSGSNALKVNVSAVGENAWDIQAGPAGLLVQPGQTYIYSAFAKGAAGTKANFVAGLQMDPYTTLEEQSMVFNGLWQQITFDFTVPADTPVLTAAQLEAAGLESDAVVAQIHMPVQLSYAENADRTIFLDDFNLLPNAVSNGDLEDSATDAEGWSWQAPDDTTTFALDTEEAHTGDNSLKIDIAEIAEDAAINTWDMQAGIASIPVLGGRTYSISARIKGDAGAKTKLALNLAIDPYDEYGSAGGEDKEGGEQDSEGKDTPNGIPDGIEITEDWQEITFNAVIPAGVETVSLMAQLGFIENSKATIYLDSFKVVSQIPIGGDLVSLNPEVLKTSVVSNGGLEHSESVASGWSGYANAPGEAMFEVDATEAHSGGNSYKASIITQAVDPWGIAAGPDNIPVTPGQSYIFSAWVKASAGAKVNFAVSMQVEPWTGYGSQMFDVDGAWKQVTFELTIPEDADLTHVNAKAQLSYAENVGAEIYLDDVTLIPTSVTNGDLELSGDEAIGWTLNTGDLAVLALTQNEAHSGNNSLKVEFLDLSAAESDDTLKLWSVESGISDIAVKGGVTYHFSGRVKGDRGMKAQFVMGLPAPSYDVLTLMKVDVSSDWQEVSFDATIPADVDIARVVVQMGYSENTNKILYLDSFKVVPKRVLTNGDLESSPSEAVAWSPGGLTATVNTEEVHSGLYSLRTVLGDVSAKANPWDSSTGLSNISVQDGTSYKFTGWIKGAVGTKANFLLQLPVDPWTTFGSNEFEITSTEWQLVEFEAAVVTSDGIANLPVHLGYGKNSNATFYFDDFKLIPIGPNPVEAVIAE